jgi:hypothetical protein
MWLMVIELGMSALKSINKQVRSGSLKSMNIFKNDSDDDRATREHEGISNDETRVDIHSFNWE